MILRGELEDGGGRRGAGALALPEHWLRVWIGLFLFEIERWERLERSDFA